jgi:multidrug efflux pump subunit AcrA (membrane-fusion protein)
MSAAHMASQFARQEMRRALRAGLCGTLLGFLALSAWAALAPLAGAVIAEGTVQSAGHRKTVQHAEGGIVAAIHVKDGDRVVQGQPLITLADERVAAGAQSLREQWAASALKAQRLQAEMAGIRFAPELEALTNASQRAAMRVTRRDGRYWPSASKDCLLPAPTSRPSRRAGWASSCCRFSARSRSRTNSSSRPNHR